jgi:LysM repeat protein
MTPKFLCAIGATASVFLFPALRAAAATDLDQEYEVARRIALRDAKVREAYEEADRKLEARIVQVDPALAGYTPHHAGGRASAQASTPPKPKEKSKPAAASPAQGGFYATHTVAKDETLGAIARKYGVTVAALKSINHITDEKKLSIGQILTIPPKK